MISVVVLLDTFFKVVSLPHAVVMGHVGRLHSWQNAGVSASHHNPLVSLPCSSLAPISVDKLCIQACKGLCKLDAGSFDAHVVDTFTTRLSDGSEVELKPDGRRISVTPDNVQEFVSLVMQARLSEGSAQVRACVRACV